MRACFGMKDFARVATAHGEGIFRVRLNEGQQRGSLFVPIHWNGETASSARACDLVAPHTDPFSGQPEAKATPAAIAPVEFAYRGFALTRAADRAAGGTWWARVAVTGGIGTLLASNDGPKLWREHARTIDGSDELAEFIDLRARHLSRRGVPRRPARGALFLGPADAAPQWDAVKALFESRGARRDRAPHGAVRPRRRRPAETGPVICACFGVGLNVIRDAIASKSATNVEAIGKALRAGTNCGSCLPELKRIVHEHAHAV